MVVNIKRLDDLLRSRIVELFDGKSINDEVGAFAKSSPELAHADLQFGLLSVSTTSTGTEGKIALAEAQALADVRAAAANAARFAGLRLAAWQAASSRCQHDVWSLLRPGQSPRRRRGPIPGPERGRTASTATATARDSRSVALARMQ